MRGLGSTTATMITMVMAMTVLGGACASSPSGPAPASDAQCRKLTVVGEFPGEVASDSYEGVLSEAEGSDAADRSESFFVITLERPFCAGDEATDRSRDEVQVFTGDASLNPKLRALLGKRVVANGPGFEAHTAHHHRPVVVDVKAIEAL